MTVVTQTSYSASVSYFDRNPISDFKCVPMLADFEMREITRAALLCTCCKGISHHEYNRTAVSYSSQFLTKQRGRRVAVDVFDKNIQIDAKRRSSK